MCSSDLFDSPTLLHVIGRAWGAENARINGTYRLVGAHEGRPVYAKPGTHSVIRYSAKSDRWLIDCDGLQEPSIVSRLYQWVLNGAASAAGEICKVRQAAVSRTAVSHNFLWLGGWAFAAPCYWSFRRYDWKARALAIPFLFYAGTFAGRVVGDIVTGKNSEFARDTFLGSLPAKVYYTAPKDD